MACSRPGHACMHAWSTTTEARIAAVRAPVEVRTQSTARGKGANPRIGGPRPKTEHGPAAVRPASRGGRIPRATPRLRRRSKRPPSPPPPPPQGAAKGCTGPNSRHSAGAGPDQRQRPRRKIKQCRRPACRRAGGAAQGIYLPPPSPSAPVGICTNGVAPPSPTTSGSLPSHSFVLSHSM